MATTTKKKVNITAETGVKEATIAGLQEAATLVGAPAEARLNLTPGTTVYKEDNTVDEDNSYAFRVSFSWTEDK